MTEVLSKSLLHEGWTRLFQLRIRLRTGVEIDREVGEFSAAVAVLPFHPDRRSVVLVRQLRPGVILDNDGDGLLLEAPAGVIDEGEDAESACRREAIEEIGIRLNQLIPAGGRAFSSPGRCSETITLFLAAYADEDRVGSGGGVDHDHEDIEVVEMSCRDLAAACDAGEIPDLKTLALASALRLKRPDLFI